MAALRAEAEALRGEAGSTVERIGEAKSAFAGLGEEVAQWAAGALERIEAARAEVRGEIDAMAAAKAALEESLGAAMQSLEERSAGLGGAAEDAERRVGDAAETLLRQSEKLGQTTGSATRTLEDAAAVFLTQSTALVKASREAMQQSEAVRQAEFHARRDAFLNAAKFVLESLHSLSVDFNRLLDEEIPEKTWKAFYRGDSTIFTRRLLGMRDHFPADAIRRKYDEDGEFRGYVQRYLRQFEELFDQAVRQEQGDVLSSTLMTSDVGKVYLLICTALGRERRSIGDVRPPTPAAAAAE
jgi:hypothetical protein